MHAKLLDFLGCPVADGYLFPVKDNRSYMLASFDGRLFIRSGPPARVTVFREVRVHELNLEDTPLTGIKLHDE